MKARVDVRRLWCERVFAQAFEVSVAERVHARARALAVWPPAWPLRDYATVRMRGNPHED